MTLPWYPCGFAGRLEDQQGILPAFGRRELLDSTAGNLADWHGPPRPGVDPGRTGHSPSRELSPVDGEGGPISQIAHEPFPPAVPRGQVQHRPVGVAAASEDGLVRDQVPPLLARLEDLPEDPHLDRARGI